MEKGFFIPGHVQKGYHPCQTETRRNHCSDRARPLSRVLACESFVGIFVDGPSLEDQSNNDVTFELFDTGTAFTKLNYSGKGVRA